MTVFARPQNLVLLSLIFLTFVLRFPSFFEPYWYGDELIRLVVSREWFTGSTLYEQIFDNSPPFLYLIFGLAKSIFWLKILAFVWVGSAIIVFYFFAKKLTKTFKLNSAYPKIATFLFILFTSTPIFEGNIAAAEIFVLFPVIAAMVLIWDIKGKNQVLLGILAGILFAIASLIRIQSVTDLLTAAIFLFFFKNSKLAVTILASFFSIWITVLITFVITGNLQSMISAVFLGNFDYVNYSNQLVFPFGLLILKVFIVLTAFAGLLKMKAVFGKFEFFLFLWLIFSFFGASIGGRGYLHYLLQITPAASLLVAQILQKKFQDFVKVFSFIIVFVVFFVLQGFYLPRFFSYYANFGKIFNNPESFNNWFSKDVTQTETIADYIRAKTLKDDKILVLGNVPQIYFLSERRPATKYVAAYHLNFQTSAKLETLKDFVNNPPKVVVVFPEGSNELPEIVPILTKIYRPTFQIGQGQIWERRF